MLPPSLSPERAKVAEFYSAGSGTIPPLPWQTFPPPFSDGSPAELESYLEQYPEGTFASLARTRLDAAARSPIDGPADPTPVEAAADALDLAFWESVKDSGRREELQAYLDQHPNGHFAGLTRARLSSPEVI